MLQSQMLRVIRKKGEKTHSLHIRHYKKVVPVLGEKKQTC